MTTAAKIWLTGICWLAIILAFVFFKNREASNGFKRGNTYEARRLQLIDLKYNSWYLAGLSHNRIYLGNTTAPLGLLSCSYNLQDTLHMKLPFSRTLKLDWKATRLRVDSPWLCLLDYKTPAQVLASSPFLQEKYYPLHGMHFDLMQLLSPGSVIVNGYGPAAGRKSLQKVWLRDKPVIDTSRRYAHQLQKTGNFSIDGFITINKKQNAVLFTYYYRNCFVCLDTNLRLRYIGKTIDTNSLAKLQVESLEVNGKKVQTITGTPVVISKRAYSEGNFMYIQASLKADNEHFMLFEEPVTIDVYHLDSGNYSHSLHLPGYKGEKLSGFAVRGNMLIALYGRYMITYSINAHKLKPEKNET